MASVALHNGMRAEQWKPIEVVLNRLIGNLPAQNRVALCAIGSHLRAVNVRMAIGAVFTDVRKYRLRMATRARYFRVHSAKWIFCGVVIEFGDRANRGPA